jgi:hypothetical protein
MENSEMVKMRAKNTVGYSEASSKKSFMVGVSVATTILEEKYEKIIKQLEDANKSAGLLRDIYEKDLVTMSNIMDRYSDRGVVEM